jgi:hypothetical protein
MSVHVDVLHRTRRRHPWIALSEHQIRLTFCFPRASVLLDPAPPKVNACTKIVGNPSAPKLSSIHPKISTTACGSKVQYAFVQEEREDSITVDKSRAPHVVSYGGA